MIPIAPLGSSSIPLTHHTKTGYLPCQVSTMLSFKDTEWAMRPILQCLQLVYLSPGDFPWKENKFLFQIWQKNIRSCISMFLRKGIDGEYIRKYIYVIKINYLN